MHSFIRPKLNNSQFGFLKNRSCLSQLLSFVYDITLNLENKRSFDIVYLDFRVKVDNMPKELYENALGNIQKTQFTQKH